MLRALASHLLAPDRPSHGPSFASHLAVLMDDARGGAQLKELGRCVRGILGLQAGDPEELRSVNRRVRERTGSRARGQGHRRFGDGR
eukprot:g21040.t1